MDLGETFELAGFATTLCATLTEARTALLAAPFALIILDVILPDGDGVEFMRQVKTSAATANIPIILLSSEKESRHRIPLLQTGADEYVGKLYHQLYIVPPPRSPFRTKPPHTP